jgi:hypothetical protein
LKTTIPDIGLYIMGVIEAFGISFSIGKVFQGGYSDSHEN